MSNQDTPLSDEVAAHMYRLACAQRLLRYCRQQGVDEQAVVSGKIELDLSPICGPDGKIQPEAVDYAAVEAHGGA